MFNSKKRAAYAAATRVSQLASAHPEYRIICSVVQYSNFKWRLQVWCGVAPMSVMTADEANAWVNNFSTMKLVHEHKVRMLQPAGAA